MRSRSAIGDGWLIFALGLVSLVFAISTPEVPHRLHTGIADLFVVLFFGEVAVGATYWPSPARFIGALTLGLVVGLPTTAILVVNNLRDQLTGAQVNKRTWSCALATLGQIEYQLDACLVRKRRWGRVWSGAAARRRSAPSVCTCAAAYSPARLSRRPEPDARQTARDGLLCPSW